MELPHGVLRMSASASAVVALLTTAAYVVAIRQEGNDAFWEVFPWVTIMLIGTGAALAPALAPDPRTGRLSAIAATAILGALGVVAILSVGIGFIVAALLACLTAVSASRAAGAT